MSRFHREMSNSVRNCLVRASGKGSPHRLERPSQREQAVNMLNPGLKGGASQFPKDKGIWALSVDLGGMLVLG